MKRLIYYVQKNLINAKMLIALLIAFVWCFLYVSDYVTLSEMTEKHVNVIEPAIYMLSSGSVASFVLVILFIFAFCDVPFGDGILPYYVHRTGYKKWFFALTVFTLVFCLIFLILPVLISCLLSARRGYFSLEAWSGVAQLTANGGAPQMSFLPVFSPILMYYSPIEALLNSFLLTFLHYLLLAELLLLFNLYIKKTLGLCAVMGIELAGYILTIVLPNMARFFPLASTSLAELSFYKFPKELSSAPYAWEIYIWLSCIIIFIGAVNLFKMRRYKFELGEAK